MIVISVLKSWKKNVVIIVTIESNWWSFGVFLSSILIEVWKEMLSRLIQFIQLNEMKFLFSKACYHDCCWLETLPLVYNWAKWKSEFWKLVKDWVLNWKSCFKLLTINLNVSFWNRWTLRFRLFQKIKFYWKLN